MSLFVVDMLVVVGSAVVGLITGVVLQYRQSRRAVAGNSARQLENNLEKSRLVMTQLHELAANMAADVGHHSDHVREMNEELRLSGGDADLVVSTISKVIAANDRMQQQLKTAEQKLQAQARQIESSAEEARTDALTGLGNRRAFDDILSRSFKAFGEKHEPTSIMIMDVDHFKKFNDTHGHLAGDAVLKEVAKQLAKSTGNRGLVTRYGGEEFAVIYPGLNMWEVQEEAEKTRARIAKSIVEYEGIDLRVTMSAGLAQIQPRESLSDLIQRADASLYASKKAGRNQGHWNDGRESHSMAEPCPGAEKTKARKTSSLTLKGNEMDFAEAGERLDPQTRLWTRQAFLDDLERRLSGRLRGDETKLSVILVEIDSYAELAEEVKNVAISTTKQFLRASMRAMDHVARYGENSFALMLPGTELHQAGGAAERIRAAVECCDIELEDATFNFTLSLGVAAARPRDEAETLLKRGEQAAKSATAAGGNCGYLHDGDRCSAVSTPETVSAEA